MKKGSNQRTIDNRDHKEDKAPENLAQTPNQTSKTVTQEDPPKTVTTTQASTRFN